MSKSQRTTIIAFPICSRFVKLQSALFTSLRFGLSPASNCSSLYLVQGQLSSSLLFLLHHKTANRASWFICPFDVILWSKLTRRETIFVTKGYRYPNFDVQSSTLFDSPPTTGLLTSALNRQHSSNNVVVVVAAYFLNHTPATSTIRVPESARWSLRIYKRERQPSLFYLLSSLSRDGFLALDRYWRFG